VAIVDRIQPQIFNMPTKCWEHHSHIYPRDRYSTYKLSLIVSDS
jgi:hypothetical protein